MDLTATAELGPDVNIRVAVVDCPCEDDCGVEQLEVRLYSGPSGVAELVIRGDIPHVLAAAERIAADCTRLAAPTPV